MSKIWRTGLDAAVREHYPALLAFATMLTPDIDEAHELVDTGIVTTMGRIRAPDSTAAQLSAVKDHVAASYVTRHRADARSTTDNATSNGEAPVAAPDSAYAPPAVDEDRPGNPGQQGPALHTSSTDAELSPVGVATRGSLMALALTSLTPAQRVAAMSWWVEGLSADDVALRLDCTLESAIDVLYSAGVTLTKATSGSDAPLRDHYAGSGDIANVEVSSGQRHA